MISAVVITKNEEGSIAGCLESLSWCSELVVVDDDSTDGTRAIARSFSAKVFRREMRGNFAAQRNFGLKKAKGEWVLFVDTDELVSRALADEIKMKLERPKADGYLVKRVDMFMGKKMTGGEWGSNWLLRLARKRKGRWRRRVHETWSVSGKVVRLSSPLLHSPSPRLGKFLDKVDLYSTIHAESNLKEGKKATLAKVIFYPIFKFVLNFFIKGGYRDGAHGFVYAILMSFHSFLAWSKLWTR